MSSSEHVSSDSYITCRSQGPRARDPSVDCELTELITEAFIVCRNFDPSKVPLPPSFSTQSLTDLAKQTTGTLTLESLAYLNRDGPPPSEDSMREWSRIKAFVESGSLESVNPHSQGQ